jgi:hypothetical protein
MIGCVTLPGVLVRPHDSELDELRATYAPPRGEPGDPVVDAGL